MRAVVVVKDYVEPGFEADDIHLVILENGTGGRAITETGEVRAMAKDKIRAIKKAERLVEKFDEFYNVQGLSIAFDRFDEEVLHAVESIGAEVVYAFAPIPISWLPDNVSLVFPKGELRFDRILYVHSFGKTNTSWLEKGEKVFILGIVQPTMPPEASSRKFREDFESMERETEELTQKFNAEKVVIRGNIVEDTLKFAKTHKANVIVLNRGIGRENIERIVERARASVIVT